MNDTHIQEKAPEPARPKETTTDKVLDKVPGDGRAYTSYIFALTGLVLWTLDNYAFHGNVPSQVSGALYTLIPAGIGFIATHLIRKYTKL